MKKMPGKIQVGWEFRWSRFKVLIHRLPIAAVVLGVFLVLSVTARIIYCSLHLLAGRNIAQQVEERAHVGNQGPPFCALNKDLCSEGLATKWFLQDWLRTSGRLQHKIADQHSKKCEGFTGHPETVGTRRIQANSTDREVACAPIKLFVHEAVHKWFGDAVWLRQGALESCTARCSMAVGPDDADLIVFNLGVDKGTRQSKPHQLRAVLNMEAHSVHPQTLAETDVLISFHSEADIQVSYAYTLVSNSPCRRGNRSTTCLEQGNTWCNVCHNNQLRDKSKSNASIGINIGTEAFLRAAMDYVPAMMRAYRRKTGEFRGEIAAEKPASAFKNINLSHAPLKPPAVGDESLGDDSRIAVFMSASCDRHEHFLRSLMQHMQVDSYGDCFRNKQERGHTAFEMLTASGARQRMRGPVPSDRSESKMLIASTYKFYLAIENSILPDYVTEKFYEGFMTAAVMVYLGAPNARKFAPANNSFIDALDFATPAALADFLRHVAANQSLYHSYTLWRRSPRLLDKFLCAVQTDLTLMDAGSLLCRACRLAVQRKCK
jgi:hypothetical protein